MTHTNDKKDYSPTSQMKPHDQIIDDNYLQPVVQALTELSEERKRKIIAIDGRCGSGKTTIAHKIQKLFDCNVIHMDDFFLPFEMKTKDRLAEPGGNVHYERVTSEILEPLTNNTMQAIHHQPYNCETRTLAPPVSTPYKQLNIIEGVYSMHPALIGFYDFKIFLTVDKEVQLERIKRRSLNQLQMFIDQWIPMEEDYFQLMKVEEKSDMIIDTSKIF